MGAPGFEGVASIIRAASGLHLLAILGSCATSPTKKDKHDIRPPPFRQRPGHTHSGHGRRFCEQSPGRRHRLHSEEHITAKAWGDVWQRPGLELKTRSMITVAMLIAMGKQHELKGHVRGALNNGVTTAELQEILLHAAVYCGVPSAVEAFRTAAEVVFGPQRQA